MIALDLFAGCGGLSLGLQWAGIEVVAAVEQDPDPCASYRANVGDHVIEANIEDVRPEDLPDVDLIAGGPPCQGYSSAGKRDPDDPRNRLWREFHRIVAAKRPAWFLVENVPRLVWQGFHVEIMNAFEHLGYEVDLRILDAANYGVPQHRDRVFIIGNRLGFPIPFPEPIHLGKRPRPRRKGRPKPDPSRQPPLALAPWVTVRQALGIGGPMRSVHRGNSPDYDGDESPARAITGLARSDHGFLLDRPSPTILGCNAEASGHTGAAEPLRHRELLTAIHEAEQDAILDEPSATLRDGRGHHVSRDHLAKNGIVRPAGFVPDIVDAYEVSPAIMAGSNGRVSNPGHHDPGESRFGKLRRLSLRECQTLQSFPDPFPLAGSKTSGYRQNGNAVPPLLAKAIGAAILAAHERATATRTEDQSDEQAER